MHVALQAEQMAKEQMNENYELHEENKRLVEENANSYEGRNAMNRWLIHIRARNAQCPECYGRHREEEEKFFAAPKAEVEE
jgi:hypothetical protein